MGSGKSWTGQRLAALLGLPFVDLDAEVETLTEMSIPTLFSRYGEAAFRDLEAQALRQFPAGRAVVLATGGGAPCFHGGMDWMNEQGCTVFLDPSPTILLARLNAGRAHRPLLGTTEELAIFIANKLAERRPTYEKAKIHLPIEDPNADVARLLYDRLQPTTEHH
ncbi:shikimate kinase [Neolewinella lacunae]|uniref:Shikimate kinase n=1 Tax=Neolewinella lacunae TaxID=1517758 RepID=A0A923PPT2_9BACT|nr:shikimate kinase [Neolewinella lacunae]MBC6995239.1 shikimate kinase [Neolewinella lacunae]MDN3635452.1 shikimate kinase [Neolewinella lacunae]